MFDLTPSERRGALVVLTLVALGAAWDLLHLRPVPAPGADGSPAEAAAISAPAAPPAASPPSGPALDLNSADSRQLDALPGIGPVLASRIVAHRAAAGPFRTVDELRAVRGIGPRLLERLRPLVRAGDAPRMLRPAVPQNATPPHP